MKKMKNLKKAFTLAEVLITLTIIGVVSAITIPVVISNQKDTELVTQYKKSFSVLSQAVNEVIMLDFGGDSGCWYETNDEGKALSVEWSGCRDFYKALTKKLNSIKTCESNAKSGGCVPAYSGYAAAGQGCSGFSVNEININNSAFVLADGQIIINYGNIFSGNNPAPLFAVDINGMKGPNKGGYDLFVFKIAKPARSGSYTLMYDSCGLLAPGGRIGKEMFMHAFAGKD